MRAAEALLWLVVLLGGRGWAQSPAVGKPAVQSEQPGTVPVAPRATLVAKGRVKIPSELAGLFVEPLKCDPSGHLYLRTFEDGGVRKLESSGRRVAVFHATGADDKTLTGGYFAVGSGDEVYQLTFVRDQVSPYVFVYRPDGTLKSKIEIQTGWPWAPARIAPFPSGDLLVAGQEYDRDKSQTMWPFTAVFSANGKLVKEVVLQDDEELRAMAARGDATVTSPQNPTSNRAVSLGEAELGADGNVYLMRRLSPAIFYAISPTGQLVRRFTVDPGRAGYEPGAMHLSGNRIAVLFWEANDRLEILKVVDLQGREIASYEEPVVNGVPALGPAFVCYTDNPERFTFLTTMEDQTLGLSIAEPR